MENDSFQHSTESDVDLVGIMSLNHPSIDKDSDFSISSMFRDGTESSVSIERRVARDRDPSSSYGAVYDLQRRNRSSRHLNYVPIARHRPLSQPTCTITREHSIDGRSFQSEPALRGSAAASSSPSISSRYVRPELNPESLLSLERDIREQGTKSLPRTESPMTTWSAEASELFAGYPSETRQRIERSLSRLRDLSLSSRRSKHKETWTSPRQSHLEADGIAKGQRNSSETEEWVSDSSILKDLPVVDSAYKAALQERDQKLIERIDERYRDMTTALDARIKSLEAEVQKTNEDIEKSREYLERADPVVRIDSGVQADIIAVEDFKNKVRKVEALQSLLDELDLNDIEELRTAARDWRAKAQMFNRLQSFVDRIEDITWETPYVPLLSICQQHKMLVSMMRNCPDDICESHRAQFEMALLEAEQEKTKARNSDPYSTERLNATFERLVRWSHTVRHVTS